MLLVLNVVYNGKLAAHVSKEIHRSRGWRACQWLKRYKHEGIDGLKDIPKSGRPTESSVDLEYKIKTILRESNHGWTTTKQIEELIVQQTGVRYHPNHVYRVKKWGFKQKVPRKICKHSIKGRKRRF